MCVVVDPPALISVFKNTDGAHREFKPIAAWILDGPGKLVMGGKLYKQELARLKSILPMLSELSKKKKLISVDDGSANRQVDIVKKIERSKDFDDPHLVALVRITKCKIVCTKDIRSHRHLRQSNLYDKPSDRPKLYTGARNTSLLCPRNVVACCR